MIFHDTTLFSEPPLPVGTTYTITTNQTWTCPATGQWQVELHGGGGGGSAGVISGYSFTAGGGGGGSGEMYTIGLSRGQNYDVTIGMGGSVGQYSGSNRDAIGGTGGTTVFGPVSCPGGAGGTGGVRSPTGNVSDGIGGAASGSLAERGGNGNGNVNAAGGAGNKNNPQQLYGTGGQGNRLGSTAADAAATAGHDGAVILTYLGK